jgi:3-phenylpropionate/trans-cinnamate dioxygenase ferredoxin component
MALFEIPGGNRLAEGGMGGFIVNGKKILLAKYKGKYFAIDTICPHMGGDLSRGTLEGKHVICPQHGHKIDITTGNHASGLRLPFPKSQTEKAVSYPVIVEGESVKIEL